MHQRQSSTRLGAVTCATSALGISQAIVRGLYTVSHVTMPVCMSLRCACVLCFRKTAFLLRFRHLAFGDNTAKGFVFLRPPQQNHVERFGASLFASSDRYRKRLVLRAVRFKRHRAKHVVHLTQLHRMRCHTRNTQHVARTHAPPLPLPPLPPRARVCCVERDESRR